MKLYRDPFFHDTPFCVLVVPERRGDFEPFWLDDNNSWKTVAEAEQAIERAIRTGEGI